MFNIFESEYITYEEIVKKKKKKKLIIAVWEWEIVDEIDHKI